MQQTILQILYNIRLLGVLQSWISSSRKISAMEQGTLLLIISIFVTASVISTLEARVASASGDDSLSEVHVPSGVCQICPSIFALWSCMRPEVLWLHTHHLFPAEQVWSHLWCRGGLYRNSGQPWGRGRVLRTHFIIGAMKVEFIRKVDFSSTWRC